jgi:hypothetical protein
MATEVQPAQLMAKAVLCHNCLLASHMLPITSQLIMMP